jgi:hypothetical protein
MFGRVDFLPRRCKGQLRMRSVSEMSGADDAPRKKSNVVRLGTETLYAIADELRRMYDSDLRSRPSERLDRLLRAIEQGDDVPPSPDKT